MNKYELKAERLRRANEYLNYGVKEGIYDPDMFEGMTSDELIEFADKEADRGDYAYDNAKEEGRT